MKTRYGIIQNVDFEEFLRAVNEALEKGWQLQGGVSTTINRRDNVVYTQAFIETDMLTEGK
jgi:hypothetical protein